MASYVGETLLFKKSAAVILILVGILLSVVGINEQSSPTIVVGVLCFLGGVLLLVFKIVRRNQSNQP